MDRAEKRRGSDVIAWHCRGTLLGAPPSVGDRSLIHIMIDS